MAIYDINGNILNSAFDVEGAGIARAYDINGNKIFPTGSDYSDYSYTIAWTNSDMSSSGNDQGFDYYNNKFFWFKSASNGAGKTYIIDGDTGVTELFTTNIIGGHANNVSFGGFYSENDEYPILYAGGASATPMIYANRITSYDGETLTAELLKTYTFPSDAGARFDATISESDPNVMITAGYNYDNYSSSDVYAEFNICWWDLTNLTENTNGTYTPTLLNKIVTEAVYVSKRSSDNQVGVKQSIREHDGLIWIATGYNIVAGYIYAYDKETGDVKFTIDLNTTTEVEGIQFLPDSTSLGGYALYVALQNGNMRKYIFS